MVQRAAELWRPPLFEPADSPIQKAKASLRRFLDLQAGSIWNDLSGILPFVPGTILDVGCGAQPYRQLLAPEATYLGIDTVDARSHFGYEMPDVRYFSGDIWPVEDASVNLVLCTETMEHVPDPSRLLDEAFRCLASGGTLLMTVPFAARWHFIPYDYWRFTPSGLERLLSRAGFLNVRVYARGDAVTVACYKVMALILRFILPQNPSAAIRALLRLLAIPLIPVLALLALVANLSLRGPGGDDCLGYTVLGEKP